MSSITKFCKVCQDAGKPETEYKSHFTRETKDKNSTVICPTLLAQECRYCFKNGHTVKYCPSLKQKTNTNITKKPVISTEGKKPKTNINTNKFAYLDWGSDDDEEDKPVTNQNHSTIKQIEKTVKVVKTTKEAEEFPCLMGTRPMGSRSQPSLLNYAAALTAHPLALVKPEDEEEEEEEEEPIIIQKRVKEIILSKPAPWAKQTSSQQKTLNWADMDSDTEEEDNSAW
jgi:hypothetical protein